MIESETCKVATKALPAVAQQKALKPHRASASCSRWPVDTGNGSWRWPGEDWSVRVAARRRW